MSASLVGSEMCIRDRPTQIPPPPHSPDQVSTTTRNTTLTPEAPFGVVQGGGSHPAQETAENCKAA
eukprot:12249673-Alexandrium_andersonii.AAC.1